MLEKFAHDSYMMGVIDTLNSMDIDHSVKVASLQAIEKTANKAAILEQLANARSAISGAGKSVGSRIMEAGRNLGRKQDSYGSIMDRGTSRRLGDLGIIGAGGVGATALGASLLGDEEEEGFSNAELAALGLGGTAALGGGLYAANEAGLL